MTAKLAIFLKILPMVSSILAHHIDKQSYPVPKTPLEQSNNPSKSNSQEIKSTLGYTVTNN